MTPLERKQASETRLRELGAPVNPHLPVLDDEAPLRDPFEVAQRVLVLAQVVAVGHGQDRVKTCSWLASEELMEALSPDERAFLDARHPTERQKFAAQWEVESLQALLWALGRVEALPTLDVLCDARTFMEGVPLLGDDTAAFIREASLRPEELLRAEADFIYRVHWGTREALLHQKPHPLGWNEGVASQRHQALHWVAGWGESWDDVPLDT